MNRLPDIAQDRISTASIGGALVLVGAVLLGVEFMDLEAGEAWPVFVIAPGIGLVITGLVGVRARWLVVTGTLAAVITAVGLALIGWTLLRRKPAPASQAMHKDMEN